MIGMGDVCHCAQVKPLFPAGDELEETVELEGTEQWLSTETIGPEQLGSAES